MNCDGRCRAHPLAKVLTGRKAAITLTSSGVLLLLSGCGDVVTTHYETYDQAAREGLFDRGWLPEVIPISSHDIRASNNLDRNTSEGEFSFAPETMASFVRSLVPFSPEDAADAGLPEVVARRQAEGYVNAHSSSSWVLAPKVFGPAVGGRTGVAAIHIEMGDERPVVPELDPDLVGSLVAHGLGSRALSPMGPGDEDGPGGDVVADLTRCWASR